MVIWDCYPTNCLSAYFDQTRLEELQTLFVIFEIFRLELSLLQVIRYIPGARRNLKVADLLDLYKDRSRLQEADFTGSFNLLLFVWMYN